MKLWLHALLLALCAAVAVALTLDEPQFGDDFTYWNYGFDMHEIGLKSWTKDGFHHLRWPIWGLCWLGQGLFGYGLASYYFVPVFYLALAALGAFAVGWHLFRRLPAAWACGLVVLFHPILDINLGRPYPDVGEGVFGAGAIFAWWVLMHADTRRQRVLASLAGGLFLFLGEENRFTGVFFIPLLVCLTLLFFRRQFLRTLLPIAVFGVLLFGQMAFYHARFGDWLFFIHANATAKGRSGTEAIALYKVPFRFLDSLHKGDALFSIYAAFAVLGLWFAWRKHGRPGRVVIAWFVLLYLAYACAPQKIWPFHPMLRVADRFLSALVIPYSVLVVMGVAGVLQWLAAWKFTRRAADGVLRHPALACLGGALLLIGGAMEPLGDRDWFNLGYVPEFRAYMRALPDGTTVFTHRQGYVLAQLVDSAQAERLHFIAEDKWITEESPRLTAEIAKASEFWYIRKLALMKFAKGIVTNDDDKKLVRQPPLAPWFDAPERDWRLMAAYARSDTPDVILYRRRTPETPPPLILSGDAPAFQGLLPAFPLAWKRGGRDLHKDPAETTWEIPAALRGHLVRMEMVCASDERDAFTVQVTFVANGHEDDPYLLKPYFFPDGGKEFVCLKIPPGADHCIFRVRFDQKTKWVKVDSFRVIAD